MEMEDKLEVLGDSPPQQTHPCESGDAIEFSNICLHFTADAASTDHINHRNELFRTYRGLMLLDIAAKASSPVGISSLNTHKGTLPFESFPDSTFQRLMFSHQETFSCTRICYFCIYRNMRPLSIQKGALLSVLCNYMYFPLRTDCHCTGGKIIF